MFLTWKLNKKRKSQNGNKIKKTKKDWLHFIERWMNKKINSKKKKRLLNFVDLWMSLKSVASLSLSVRTISHLKINKLNLFSGYKFK